jgi:hypothetical protein
MLLNYTAYITSNARLTVNDELRKIWKEAAMDCFQILSSICLARLRKIMETVSHDGRCPGRESDPVSLAYKAGLLTRTSQE